MVNTAEAGDTQVSIRGINGPRDAEANFAFIVDGILYTNPSAFNREFAGIRQIEVLKGPQGALYGRNASAGAIVVTTREPSNEFEAEVRGSVGSDDTYTASAFVSGPIASDQLYGGLHVDYRDSDGFYENEFLLRDDVTDRFENYNVTGRLVWEPNEAVKLDGRFRYGEVDASSIVFNASFFLNTLGGGAAGSFEEDVNAHAFRFVNDVPSENEQEATEFSLKLDWDLGFATLTAWTLYSDIEQFFFADGTSGDFGFFTGVEGPVVDATPEPIEATCSATAQAIDASGFQLNPPADFSLFGGFATVGIPAASIPPFSGPGESVFGPYTPSTCDGTQYQVRNQEDISFEIRLTSPADQRLRWAAGFYYLDLEREVGVNLLPDDGTPSRPKALVVPGVTESLVHDRFDTEVFAVFGNFSYDITDELEFALALRYDREDRDVTNLVPVDARTNFVNLDPNVALPFSGPFTGGSPLNPALAIFDAGNNIIGFRTSIPDRNEVFEQVQPKISLSWDVTDNTTLYGTWGIGFKSGGFNNQGSAAFIDIFFNDLFITPGGGIPLNVSDVFEKEVSSSFEFGFKSTFADGRVNLEGALYHTDIDDMQFFEFFVGTFGLLRVVTNIDEVSITGGELAVRAQLSDAWSVFGGVGIVDGEIDENRNRPLTVGNEVPYAPEYTANFGIEFIQPVFGDVDFMTRVDYSVIGETWFHTLQEDDRVPNVFTLAGFPGSNLSFTERESYSLVNLRAGLEAANWTVSVFAYNLLDREWLNEVIPAPEFGGAFIAPGSRRYWGIEASYRF
jgi:iron complex outermembrane receptor protein